MPRSVVLPLKEVLSPALMRGEGYSEAFSVQHPALVSPAPPAGNGPLRARIAGLRLGAILTRRQRRAVRLVLSGLSYQQVGERLGCSKQSAHRAWRRAVGRILAHLAGDSATKGRRAA
jgi:DNA-binding CsgD family transcriptional regulator